MHASRWRTVLAVSIICVGLPLGAGGAHAQSDWVIEPGEGVGPVRLGMTEGGVHAYLKQPAAVHARGNFKTEDFQNLSVDYSRDHGSAPFRVSIIRITSGRKATASGVRLGSSVFDVVDAYGDSPGNIRRDGVSGAAVGCLGLAILKSDKAGVTLAFEYVNQGISFDTLIPRGGGSIDVTEISLYSPKRCSDLAQ